VIVLTGSTPVLPQAFQNSLKTGGRMFAVVGDAPVMEAVLVTCMAHEKETGACNTYNRVNLFETVFLRSKMRSNQSASFSEAYRLT